MFLILSSRRYLQLVLMISKRLINDVGAQIGVQQVPQSCNVVTIEPIERKKYLAECLGLMVVMKTAPSTL